MTAQTTTSQDFTKTVRLGTTEVYSGKYASVYCKIKYTDGKLSITGVEGPTRSGGAIGSCGQIRPKISNYADGWDAGQVAWFYDVWDAWHLNDMRAGCQHQQSAWDTAAKIEVVTYKLTAEAWIERRKAEAEANRAAAAGEVADLTPTGRALIGCELSTHRAPDADSPLSGCYEVDKREEKQAAWVRPDEHDAGLLGKPCDVCGHKYGSGWLREDVPADVLQFLRALPDTDQQPAWV